VKGIENCLRQAQVQMRSHPAKNLEQVRSIANDGEGLIRLFSLPTHLVGELKEKFSKLNYCGTVSARDGSRKESFSSMLFRKSNPVPDMKGKVNDAMAKRYPMPASDRG
jgi:hypothetical protein